MTVLFSDVTGSTVLGEALDPESLRRLMGRYFQEMKAVLQRHGGTTEKFIGDAVMAVFGVPRLHEDDPLRAVRAALEMRDALHELNEEFERAWGVRILARTGVNTGEVIAGDPDRGESFVVGDAVNLAARLEQTAEPGQILIGEATYHLVRDAVKADALPPLAVKGKSQPVVAWRLLEVGPGLPGWSRRFDSPLVGRDAELNALDQAFSRSVQERTCQLVTVFGAPGVGKSRLTMEFLARLGSGPRVVSGRCLPYGEGITFWPIVEVLRDAAGVSDVDSPDEARPKILGLLEPSDDAALIGERLAALLGLSGVTPGIQETFWAVRKLFEELAARRPLVIFFDDIHWGEPTFLDLIEYLVDWIQGVPVLLVCAARQELLDVRGAWMAGKSNASQVTLEGLSEPETVGLIRNLLGGDPSVGQTLSRLAEAGEGNPLFIEELFRMLVDDGRLQRSNGSWSVAGDLASLEIPPTIHALLIARLDRLDQEERAVIERASVIGRRFGWGAVTELSPDEQRPKVGGLLQSLSRKELIRPDRSDLGEEDSFRFAHILVRDAAYGTLPKTVRAELHERFADWIQTRTRDRAGEYEEVVGYHLEQAYRSLSELGPSNERTRALGQRAAGPLASAGRRAFARGDMPAAVNLLTRAAGLTEPGDKTHLDLLPDLAFALLETGDLDRMRQVVSETTAAAGGSGDLALQAEALLQGLWVRVFTDPEGWAEEAFRQATDAITIFERHHDERGLARGWSLLGLVYLFACQFGTSEEAWGNAAGHAHEAGNQREELEYLSWIPLVVWGGPRPVDEGIARCESVLEKAAGDRKAMSTALFVQAKLHAMAGRFDEARDLIGRARAILEEVALPVWLSGPLTQMSGWVDMLAGDPARAERDLRAGAEKLREIGEFSWLSTVAGILAEAVYAQGRYDDVEPFLQMTEETAGSEDAYSQSLLRSVRAKVLARSGKNDEARQLAESAVAILEPTDFLFMKAFALLSQGEVLQLGGDAERAQAVLSQAKAVCE
ncbi:MAG TPA: adenylate/guanylate cyclase domain-containing protein, partial [Actinomycetota bacterium]|nr:adenylate/guanylate cyclase domain-containing protein [Actinomycetota bacterium]